MKEETKTISTLLKRERCWLTALRGYCISKPSAAISHWVSQSASSVQLLACQLDIQEARMNIQYLFWIGQNKKTTWRWPCIHDLVTIHSNIQWHWWIWIWWNNPWLRHASAGPGRMRKKIKSDTTKPAGSAQFGWQRIPLGHERQSIRGGKVGKTERRKKELSTQIPFIGGLHFGKYWMSETFFFPLRLSSCRSGPFASSSWMLGEKPWIWLPKKKEKTWSRTKSTS